MDARTLNPTQARRKFREGLVTSTSGWSAGYTQANLIALPRDLAFDFLLFAQRNPKPCPVLEVLEPGAVRGGIFAADDADVRTDAPAYRVFSNGELVDEIPDAREVWRDDLVAFLLGCSFSFEHPLMDNGIPVRHISAGRNVPMYKTNIACRPAGSLSGNLVVSLRMIPAEQVSDAVRISSRYPAVHGAPVHIGDPRSLGIMDVESPDFGASPVAEKGDVPVFWACGVTPQAMVMDSRPELAITHAPGHMLITDQQDFRYQVP